MSAHLTDEERRERHRESNRRYRAAHRLELNAKSVAYERERRLRDPAWRRKRMDARKSSRMTPEQKARRAARRRFRYQTDGEFRARVLSQGRDFRRRSAEYVLIQNAEKRLRLNEACRADAAVYAERRRKGREKYRRKRARLGLPYRELPQRRYPDWVRMDEAIERRGTMIFSSPEVNMFNDRRKYES